jgi:hypothetical protein
MLNVAVSQIFKTPYNPGTIQPLRGSVALLSIKLLDMLHMLHVYARVYLSTHEC